jgi:hypothetical protein
MNIQQKNNFMKHFLTVLLLMIGLAVSGQQTIVVTDCNLQGWVKQTTAGTSLNFKNIDNTPLGKGMLEFSSPNINFVRFRSTAYHGTLLSSITEWGYSTFVKQRTNNRDVNYVVVLIDKNNDGRTDDNLVFDPRFQSAPYIKDGMPDQGFAKVGVWQTWDMLKGGWWIGPPPRPDPDQGGGFFTLHQYIQQNPGARIINDPALGGGGIRLTGGAVVGIFAPDFIGYSDAFRIGVNGNTKIYDFEFTIADAGKDQELIYGYGPGCTQLKGKADGGTAPYQYSWTPAVEMVSESTARVCPTATTKYILTVKDSKGCTGTDDVIVNVTDVRCGNKLDKVKVCHNGEEICISKNAVQAHIDHGDALGACKDIQQTASRGMINYEVKRGLSGKPNPFTASTVIHYSLPAASSVSLSVFDVTGRKLETLVEGQIAAGEHEAIFNDKGKGKGVYIARLEYISGGKKYSETVRLLKLNN